MSKREEVQRIRGGASGLAAAIQRQKEQAGGLQELRKSPSSRETRTAKSQSVYITSQPVSKPARMHSVTDPVMSSQSNGNIPRGSPALLRPMSMVTTSDFQVPPPKPPHTGSTSPSAFLSLERDVSLPDDEWDDEDDAYYEEENEDLAMKIEGCEETDVNGQHEDDYDRKDGSATPEQKEEEEDELEKTVEEGTSATIVEEEEDEVSPALVKKPHQTARTKRSMSYTSDAGPDSSPGTSSSASYGTPGSSPAVGRRDSDGKGAYPRVPLLPPGANTSPLQNKATPTSDTPSSASKKIPMLPKNSPSSLKASSHQSKSSPATPRTTSTSVSGKAFSKSCSSDTSPGGTSEENDEKLKLKRENERLKLQLMMLQSKMKSGNVSEDLDSVVEIDDPLTTECDDVESVFSRPRSRSVSPCEDGQEFMGGADTKPSKPMPLPRTRAQTVTAYVGGGGGGGGSKKPLSVPHAPSVPLLGTTTPAAAISASSSKSGITSSEVSSSAPKSTESPVPKPRSNTGPKSAVSSVSSDTVKAATKSEVVGGNSSRKGSEQVEESDTGNAGERSDSAGSNYSASSAEKIRASMMLQKLLPRSNSPAGSVTVTKQLSTDIKSTQHSGTKILTSSAVQSAVTPSSSSSPKPIPVPRSVHLSSSSSQSRPQSSSTSSSQDQQPAIAISTTASATTMGSTSQTRSQQAQATPTSAPYSSSVPSPSLLSQTSSTPGQPTSASPATIKAPLHATSQTRVYSHGKAKYKKVTLDDTSWIKRKASLDSESSLSTDDSPRPKESDHSNLSSAGNQTTVSSQGSKTPPSGSSSGTRTSQATSGTGSGTSSGSPQISSQPLPYRSHTILPTPKPVPQPFLNPPSPNVAKKSDVPSKPLPPRPEEPPKKKDSPPSPNVKAKKRMWGRKSEDNSKEVKDGKKDRKKSTNKSNSNEDLAIPSSEASGKDGGKKSSKKSSFSQSQMVEPISKSKPLMPPKKLSALDRPVSLMVDSAERRSELTASATVSMPRGMQAEEAYKQQKSSRVHGSPRLEFIDEDPVEQEAVLVQKKGLFGKRGGGKSKTVLQKTDEMEASAGVDAQDGSDSGSDDEKGGTIKKMPKLRHVSVKRPDVADDDAEPEYHQLFEYVFVVSLKEDAKKKLVTETTYSYPPTCDFKGKDSALQSIPQFCYPDIDQWKPTKTYQSESFSFVLTDIEGNRRFGYCRRLLPDGEGPRLPEVYCIISPLGCFSLYEDMLNHVEERRKVNSLSVFNFLKAISANPFPRPGRSVTVKVFGAGGSGMEPVTFTRPVDSRLEHVDFSILFSTLSKGKIIKLFSSLLMERRVIFCASSLSLMTGCAHALMALLYPFEWQHVFIPVLPSSLIDFVCSPLPYIIGINPSICQRLDEMDMEEAVVINLDKSKFIKQIGDEGSILPSKLFDFLHGKLGASVISEYSKKSSVAKKSSNTSKADELVVNTFMTFFAYLYGDYRENMKTLANGHREFQRTEHIKRFKSKSTRRFLEAFQMTQMFESFTELRELPSKAETLAASMFEKKLPELKIRCQDIEIFSSKSRFDRWKMKKDLAKGD